MAGEAQPQQQLHAEEDWQAQLEELLALQSIFADDFRCVCARMRACVWHTRVQHAHLHTPHLLLLLLPFASTG